MFTLLKYKINKLGFNEWIYIYTVEFGEIPVTIKKN